MLAAIKRAAMEAVEANAPVAIMTGMVTNISPLEVIVDQRFTLDADFLIIPEALISRGLEVGDRLILLRVQGGQQYVILDRVVSQ